MAQMNIEMNVKNDTGYDQLHPKTNVNIVEGAAPKSIGATATATVARWTGTAAPFTQVIDIAGVTTTNNIEVGLASTITLDQIKMAMKCIIQCTAQANNQITLTAFKNKPTIDLPIQVIILG